MVDSLDVTTTNSMQSNTCEECAIYFPFMYFFLQLYLVILKFTCIYILCSHTSIYDKMPIHEDILASIKNNSPKLTDLNLNSLYPPLNASDIQILVDVIKKSGNTCLTSINLSENNICDESAIALSTLSTIQSLFLSTNNITDSGATALAINCPKLVYLDLSENCITNNGFEKLLTKFNLLTLVIVNNPINDRSLESILSNYTLHSLFLDFDDKIDQHFEKHSTMNRKYKMELDQVMQISSLTAIVLSYANCAACKKIL